MEEQWSLHVAILIYVQQRYCFEVKESNMPPMDDTFVLNFDIANPEWQRVNVKSSPPGRWGHTLLCLNGSWLVIFGGYRKIVGSKRY